MHKFIADIPGINNLDIEFLTTDFDDFYMVRDTVVTPFEEFELPIIDLLKAQMDEDHRIELFLYVAGILNPTDQLKRFCICRFGAYNSNPDFKHNTSSFEDTEYLACGFYGNCPYKLEGIMCQQMKVANGILTHAELTYIKFTLLNLADKEIADRLNRSVDTIKKHRQNITRKIGCSSKVGIAVFGCDHHIRFPQDYLNESLTKKGGAMLH